MYRALSILALAAGAATLSTAALADGNRRIAPTALAEQLTHGETAYVLDVRTPEEFAQGHVAGAVNIPVQDLEARMDVVPDDAEIVVYCHSGRRAAEAASLLREHGHAVTELDGSILGWRAAGLPEIGSAGAAAAIP